MKLKVGDKVFWAILRSGIDEQIFSGVVVDIVAPNGNPKFWKPSAPSDKLMAVGPDVCLPEETYIIETDDAFMRPDISILASTSKGASDLLRERWRTM